MLFIDISPNIETAHTSESAVQGTTENLIPLVISPLLDAVVEKHLPEVLTYQPDPDKARKLARKWAVLSLVEWLGIAEDISFGVIDESQVFINN